MKNIGLLGARGFVGKEIIRLVSNHPFFEIGSVFSNSLAGESLEISPSKKLVYKDLSINKLHLNNEDAFVLALPNGESTEYAKAISSHNPEAIILDLSSDNRFDNTWTYRIPELSAPISSTKISNPGCYASAMQFMLEPIKLIVKGYVHFFGVSGYSGAGSKPSPRNNKQLLKDNILPYSLVKHTHELEVRHNCYEKIFFTPHVSEFFRGILITGNFILSESQSAEKLMDLFDDFYRDHELIDIQKDAPDLQQVRHTSKVIIGGFDLDPELNRLTFCCAIDNLLKGAATQAIQNLNSAFGFEENLGII